MSSGGGFQILINLVFLASMVAIWIKLIKPAKDHPRLSRGLQLLQSKIAILEDLSDQVERQVQQVTQLIEAKSKDLQSLISQADDLVQKIDGHPHQPHAPSMDHDSMDRQNTAKYVRAAQMAHQGATVDDIISEIDISRAEAEFVIKVNRNQLQFSLEHLPGWAKAPQTNTVSPAVAQTSAAPRAPQAPLRSEPVVNEPESFSLMTAATAAFNGTPILKVRDASISPLAAEPTQARTMATPQVRANTAAQTAVKTQETGIRKVVFPRIDINRNLG